MDEEVTKLRESYERAMNAVIKAEHIIEAFLK